MDHFPIYTKGAGSNNIENFSWEEYISEYKKVDTECECVYRVGPSISPLLVDWGPFLVGCFFTQCS